MYLFNHPALPTVFSTCTSFRVDSTSLQDIVLYFSDSFSLSHLRRFTMELGRLLVLQVPHPMNRETNFTSTYQDICDKEAEISANRLPRYKQNEA
jgi:hypothetical protein